MRQLILVMLVVSLAISANGQNKTCDFRIDSLSKEKIYTRFDKSPTYGESVSTTYEYISKNFRFPNHYSGNETIVASFIINQCGEIMDIKLVEKSKNPLVNENFVQTLTSMRKWNPAICNGKQVKAEIILPFKFQ
ncbi:energy transducer TonB [Rufibacter roseus]|uniref:Energy transducer TonB n=1 Tax=Rufibacter roseus TaxID=1567108 RepID=A0ABW2DQJ7_9BACT|nr:energy transducer TonB [Rufibacter roseus]